MCYDGRISDPVMPEGVTLEVHDGRVLFARAKKKQGVDQMKRKERYMTILGGYQLDMHNHGALVRHAVPDRIEGRDYGADPLGDGRYRMVPSGDVVDYAERCQRLGVAG
jgi:hypothetical protein